MLQTIHVTPDIALRVAVTGAGEPVVFIHGLGGNLSFWAEQARGLSSGFQVVRYDLRGHGGSSPSMEQGMAVHADDLAALLDALGIESAHVVGLSMGGAVAMTFAATYPDRVRKLVPTSTTAVFPTKGKDVLRDLATLAELDGMPAVAEAFAANLFATPCEPFDPRLTALKQAFTDQNVASFAAAARALATMDLTPLLSDIRAETLLCFGEYDRQTPVFLGEWIAARVPKARLWVGENAGHVPPIESPGLFNRMLIDFLKESAR